MPRTIVMEDDSYFVLASYFNGIAHPPGYPLFTFLGHVATYIPAGSIAFRVHLLSGLFGALVCACIWLISFKYTSDRFCAYIASICLGISGAFWSQSIIADVYSLNAFLFICVFITAVSYRNDYKNKKLFFFLAFIYGLALSNHWPLIILSTPGLLILLWSCREKIIQFLPIGLIGLTLGLMPYLWMIIRSQMEPQISFYGPINSWSDFWFYISRQAYVGQEFSMSASWWDKLQFAGFMCKEITLQFGYPGLILAVTGFVRQWKEWPNTVSLGLTAIFIGNTFLLILLIGFDYDLLHKNIFKVYPLIAYAVLVVWLALGMSVILRTITAMKKINIGQNILKFTIAISLFATIFTSTASSNYRANDIWAEDFAVAILNQLDKNAVLFTHGDLDQGPLVYMHKVEGMREDVTIYNSKGVLLSNRLFYPTKDTDAQRKKAINSFINETERPVYYIYGLPHEHGDIDYGLYHQVNTTSASSVNRAIATPENIKFLSKILSSGIPIDPWESMHYKLILNNYCQLLLRLENRSNTQSRNSGKTDTIDQVCHMYHGRLIQVEMMMESNQPDWSLVRSLLDQATEIKDQAVLKSDLSKLYFLQAEMNVKTGNKQMAIEYYQLSIDSWRHQNNPSYARLKAMMNKV